MRLSTQNCPSGIKEPTKWNSPTDQYKEISPAVYESIDSSEQLFHLLLDPSNYPPKYEYFFHGSQNYWHGITISEKMEKLFKPNLDETPCVTHPHMNHNYVYTFLQAPHLKKLLPTTYFLNMMIIKTQLQLKEMKQSSQQN